MTFKFTRGGIKLNIEKLDHFDSKYRDAILWNHIPELSQKETSLINDYVTQPMLRQIDSVGKTQGSSELLPEAWRKAVLTPVPAMDPEDTRAAYVYNIFSTKKGGFLSAEMLIRQHPYLLWRVPRDLYVQSLASYNPDRRILQALRDAIEQEELWTAHGTEVMDAIWTALDGQDIDSLTVYNTLRLVGAGGHNVVSQSSSRMFMLLGRDEWRFRLDTVAKLLG